MGKTEKPPTTGGYLTLKEFSTALRCCPNTARAWIKADPGRFGAIKPGRKFLIPRQALEALAKQSEE
jgi:excisionase family DNA binding protein